MGTCASGRGVMKQEKFPHTQKTAHRQGWGEFQNHRGMQQQVLRRQNGTTHHREVNSISQPRSSLCMPTAANGGWA